MREFAIERTDLSIDCSRRQVLRGLLLGCAAWYIPSIHAAAQQDLASFEALSSILIGRNVAGSARSSRLFDALVRDNPKFASQTDELLALIRTRNVPAAQLQQLLDSEKSPLNALPRSIVSAWYLGIVGSGKTARCVDFELATNAQVVGDVLKPPTYCYGGYGSWAAKPN